MKTRTPNINEEALLTFLGCPQTEVKKYSPVVYGWRGLYFEILTEDQKKRSKTPASWYSHIPTPIGVDFYIREMGKKAEKVKKIRRNHGK